MLADLDELILKCRDERAIVTISEAVKCYKAGAYRSAIVSTWVAVAFDIIEKLRQLALSGDKGAEQLISEFETIRRQHDIVQALVFEKKLLSLARDNFELISPLEYIDLERLQDDRNRCAHPSMNSDTDIFDPPAELARLHIRSAVDHLLCQEPAQGKYALDRLLVDVRSAYFPTLSTEAINSLSNSPLKHARKSLARNFLIVLIKDRLHGELDFRVRKRLDGACLAVKHLHFEVWQDVIVNKLSDLFRALSGDEELSSAVAFVRLDPLLWDALDSDVQNKLKLFVEDLPSEMVSDLELIFSFDPLSNAASTRCHKLKLDELQWNLFVHTPVPALDHIVDTFARSTSFIMAINWGKIIQENIREFSADHVRVVIDAIGENPQISGSFGLDFLVSALRKAMIVPAETFDAFLIDNNLEHLIIPDSTEPL
ncbi:MAG: hypothetical protein WC864_03190 [Ilumatobacteraceae bacterium]